MNLNINKFWRKRSAVITDYDPTFKVVYLGNVLTAWAKGDGCVDRPLSTLWKNYCQSNKPEVGMKLTVCNSGLKAVTKEHGLTEYWANRITFCLAHPQYPRVFCWVFRHEGKKLRQELRCHAVLCSSEDKARKLANSLRTKLSMALLEFKREKVSRQKARLSLANALYDNPSLPRRKILLSTGSANYRQPLERSKSAPRLMSIDEDEEELVEEVRHRIIELVIAGEDEENSGDVCYYDSSCENNEENLVISDLNEEDDEVYILEEDDNVNSRSNSLTGEMEGEGDEEDIDLESVNSEPSGCPHRNNNNNNNEEEMDDGSISSLNSDGSSRTSSTSSVEEESSSAGDLDDGDSLEEDFPPAAHLRRNSMRRISNGNRESYVTKTASEKSVFFKDNEYVITL